MYALNRVGRLAVTAGAALVLFTGMTTTAQAATGPFSYTSVDGRVFDSENPENGECFLLVGGAAQVRNGTDSRATVYEEPGDCESRVIDTVPSHTTRNYSDTPHSVRFG
ncbi:hypothetical protein AB0D27_41355 [Streptomyces sp. NPDC048415]|jgi:hypothetical protein|uniref:hypothetical protein n=1 Tax=Streptomyces sp. NPDC048415 TaxID=3154822 RepID=UPI003436DB0D